MYHKLTLQNIRNVDDINKKLQSNYVYRNQFGYFINVYAKNQQGIKDIYKIVSKSCTDDLYKYPRVYIDDIKNERDNLIIANHPTESDV
jgi:DNA polymerase-3 subunit alpha (Gram-positive type)